MLRYGSLEPPEKRLPQAASDYKRWALARMRAFETLMAGAEYCCAGRFTMADISVGYALMLAGSIGFVIIASLSGFSLISNSTMSG